MKPEINDIETFIKTKELKPLKAPVGLIGRDSLYRLKNVYTNVS